MMKYNAENERLKRRYLRYLRSAKGYDEATIDGHARAIERFEAYNKRRSFKLFRIEQAIGFRERLASEKADGTDRLLSKATVHQILNALRAFVFWLADQPGYRSRVSYSDADYFRPNLRDERASNARPERPVPTLEQIRHVVASMPASTEIERRNRVMVAFALLTGARDRAIATMRLKHVDLGQERVTQNGGEVHTKGSKLIETWFFPVGDDLKLIVVDWVRYLREEKHFGPNDPLFPRTAVAPGADRKFAAVGIERAFWRTADPVRDVFRDAFEAAGLAYFNPHSFRKTLAQLGQRVCRTPEELKAWSQNLGHENVMTTLTSYGKIAPHRQGELIRGLSLERESRERDALAQLVQIIRDNPGIGDVLVGEEQDSKRQPNSV